MFQKRFRLQNLETRLPKSGQKRRGQIVPFSTWWWTQTISFFRLKSFATDRPQISVYEDQLWEAYVTSGLPYVKAWTCRFSIRKRLKLLSRNFTVNRSHLEGQKTRRFPTHLKGNQRIQKNFKVYYRDDCVKPPVWFLQRNFTGVRYLLSRCRKNRAGLLLIKIENGLLSRSLHMARVGLGVYFAPNHPDNLSAEVPAWQISRHTTLTDIKRNAVTLAVMLGTWQRRLIAAPRPRNRPHGLPATNLSQIRNVQRP